uniref:Uncharacterized protein n=1 Tax=Oryza rufipogon TaxID=4529 RepID=A0A0E0QER2_ORYRU
MAISNAMKFLRVGIKFKFFNLNLPKFIFFAITHLSKFKAANNHVSSKPQFGGGDLVAFCVLSTQLISIAYPPKMVELERKIGEDQYDSFI